MTQPAVPPNRGLSVSEAEFRRLWNDLALSMTDIGAILGISRQAVLLRGKCRGMHNRRRAKKTSAPIYKHRSLEFTAMFLADVKSGCMAAHFGIDRWTVNTIARALGLPNRDPRKLRARISLQQYRDRKIAAGLAASAQVTRAAMRDAEMVDKLANQRHFA